ncbi:vicilin-like antimicrobial peptides 2-2 [Forsythia ovata]|uniref:Vicilin-like antimicrobial peptides 2-2 n=1 Tax=Forsythia ovata TaxID=205694 RepID=A0ABD1T8L6_9LAMI
MPNNDRHSCLKNQRVRVIELGAMTGFVCGRGVATTSCVEMVIVGALASLNDSVFIAKSDVHPKNVQYNVKSMSNHAYLFDHRINRDPRCTNCLYSTSHNWFENGLAATPPSIPSLGALPSGSLHWPLGPRLWTLRPRSPNPQTLVDLHAKPLIPCPYLKKSYTNATSNARGHYSPIESKPSVKKNVGNSTKREERDKVVVVRGKAGDSELYPQIEDPSKVYEQCQQHCEKTKGSSSNITVKECANASMKSSRERRKKESPTEALQVRQKMIITLILNRGTNSANDSAKDKNMDMRDSTANNNVKRSIKSNNMSSLKQDGEKRKKPIIHTSLILNTGLKKGISNFLKGTGTITYVWQNQRKSFNLKRGDVLRVPAGSSSTEYLINGHNERLYILRLLRPVNTPGHFEEYFGAGGENPESFYRAFSSEILEAALTTPRDKLENLFRQRKKGVIITASREQIRALTQQSGSEKGESWGPFNLLKKLPLFSNQFGQLFEVSPNDYEQLKDLDLSVSYMNIKKGRMIAPHYNSRTTRIVFVVGGNGRYEMACPHLGRQSQQSSGH